MRGAVLAPGGKTILTLPSTAADGAISRIVPSLKEGAGVTLHRGDVHYVITEYGIAHLHGKNVRERAMDLIAIAHPKYRAWLIEEAKKSNLIYPDQAFVPGESGEYPEHLETRRTTRSGIALLMRPVRISDEPLLKDFFYSLSDQSMYRRFISARKDMPHERLQEFAVVDYNREMAILATIEKDGREMVLGMGQYMVDEERHWAEVAFVVRDDYQGKGIGTELLSYLGYLARRQGLLGFTAEVLVNNLPMLRLFEEAGFDMERREAGETYLLRLSFGKAIPSQ
jgi:GNAT superfamily N-acetyltransferase